jgi:hypothetical protein
MRAVGRISAAGVTQFWFPKAAADSLVIGMPFLTERVSGEWAYAKDLRMTAYSASR